MFFPELTTQQKSFTKLMTGGAGVERDSGNERPRRPARPAAAGAGPKAGHSQEPGL